MEQTTQNMNPEQQETIRSLKAEIRSRLLLNAGLILSAAVIAVIVILLWRKTFSLYEAASVALLAGIAVIIVNGIVFGRTEARFQSRIREIPELLPPDADPYEAAARHSADIEYTEARIQLKHEQKVIIIVSIMLSCIIPFAFLVGFGLAAARRYTRSKELETYHISACTALDTYAEKWHSVLQWAALFLVLCFAGLSLIAAGMQFTAKARVTSINTMAKQIFNAAAAYQVDLDAMDLDPHFETVIVPRGETGEKGTISYGVHYYCSDSSNYWYAVICNEKGEITETYCCRSELTPALCSPMTFEEQLDAARRLRGTNELIGYFKKGESYG